MTDIQSTQVIYPTLRYDDAPAALSFLTGSLGFREVSRTDNPDGTVGHCELEYGGGVVMVSSRNKESTVFDTGKSCLYIALDDVDAHHDKAAAAGAKIVMELTDQEYGSREYAAEDPEGNVWVFGTYRVSATSG
jgi:uncharacterized glyoxalase superfamily protein PhnB